MQCTHKYIIKKYKVVYVRNRITISQARAAAFWQLIQDCRLLSIHLLGCYLIFSLAWQHQAKVTVGSRPPACGERSSLSLIQDFSSHWHFAGKCGCAWRQSWRHPRVASVLATRLSVESGACLIGEDLNLEGGLEARRAPGRARPIVLKRDENYRHAKMLAASVQQSW